MKIKRLVIWKNDFPARAVDLGEGGRCGAGPNDVGELIDE